MGPEPMMFEIKADVAPYIKLVTLNMSKTEFYSAAEIANKTTLGYSTVMAALRSLKKEKLIEQVGDGYPKRWRLK